MHEFHVGKDIVQRAVAEARRGGAARIRSLELHLGREGHITPEALRLSIEAASEGTLAQGAELTICDAPSDGVLLASIELEDKS